MHEEDCKKSLLDGMERCDSDSTETHGETASMGCLDYSLDLSGVTQDDNSPWDERTKYSPPESAERANGDGANQVLCYTEGQPGMALTEDQTNEAIVAYCNNEVVLAGIEKYGENIFDYLPKGQTRFYNDDRYKCV
ncbi:uncharacterized protein CC84DRAFT_1211922 [Paraphaeosphaeria sporulosa]|uniref:Uncharacterized protein n=1 Tax=Paraphaeosphaeria sporulosa TaxID=1460663 RepID=A0A177CXU2_9PLEO|nr:uncharacterized protein CC84DRAFT_1211922 [Paraphaeosphaeria sporulosa]OAG12353.1 hypothetical protein CC84DRAFT_1211922 [Paraphaeosphaeria sporulosa]